MKVGHAKVSAHDQSFDLQFDALEEAGCQRISLIRHLVLERSAQDLMIY